MNLWTSFSKPAEPTQTLPRHRERDFNQNYRWMGQVNKNELTAGGKRKTEHTGGDKERKIFGENWHNSCNAITRWIQRVVWCGRGWEGGEGVTIHKLQSSSEKKRKPKHSHARAKCQRVRWYAGRETKRVLLFPHLHLINDLRQPYLDFNNW